jgi:phage terminase large subunit
VIDLGYQPRPQFASYHARTQRWACIVAHRRAGKTVACVMDLIDAALRCRRPDGRYSYIGPTYTQVKDVAWSYLKRFSAPVPGVEMRESELAVIFPNGNRVRLFGSDNFERLRGSYADGLVLDEFGDMDPRAWPEVLRPSLADRQGWATFIGTPKGRNHFYTIHQEAESSPEWFSLVLRASQTGILPPDELASARRTMTQDQWDQEFEVSFEAAIRGAIYRTELQAMEAEGRICSVPYDPAVPVTVAYDLGIGDSTCLVLAQQVGKEIHIVDYYENSGERLAHYCDWLADKPYRYATDLLPHDAAARELGTGRTREELLRANGRRVRVLPRQDVDDGINAVRMLLGRTWMDRVKTARLRECLANYHREFNDRLGVFRSEPVHNWASHGADAVRTLAMGLRETNPQPVQVREPVRLATAGGNSWMGL